MQAKQSDNGISLPLVLGAMLVFSILTILLLGVSVVSIRHSKWALFRTQALAAAEAGAQDYVNRMNGFAAFDSWTSDRTKRFRDQNVPAGAKFPQIVRDSALAQWRSVEGSSNAQYTYDVVGNNGGLIVRSTGRSGPNNEIKRTVEYRITRNSDSAVAYVGNRGFASIDAYAQQAKLFTDTTGEQGFMGVNQQTGKRFTPEEYYQKCQVPDHGQASNWHGCWRQVWNGHDYVEGNSITRAPQTIHEYKSFMYGARNLDPKLFKTPTITGSLTIQLAATNHFTHPAGFWGAKSRDFYTDEEAARFRGRDKWHYKPFDETIGSSPANFVVIREEANNFDSCVFRGSTHVVLYGETIYVRSPHTPGNTNDTKNDWCKNPTKQLWGRTKRSDSPDITKPLLQSGNYLKPGDETTWVKFDDVPAEAVFVIQKTGPEGCNVNVTGDQASVGKSTGIGFPGAQPTVSTAEPGQADLYNCKNGDLFIEGAAAFRKTFAAEDNIYLTGGIRYTDRQADGRLPVNSDDLLGLVAKRNVIVYNPSPQNGAGSKCPGCNKMPRHSYAVPTRDVDLTANETTGQGPFAANGFAQWMQGLGKEGDIMTDPTSGRPDDKAGWLVLPQYDAAIVAEEGSFFLENMNILKDRPAQKGRGRNENPLKLTVTGSVFSKYAPAFHIDRVPPQSGRRDVDRNPDYSRLEVYGYNMQFFFDKRFTKRLPPGFSGHSDSAFRATAYAEVFQNHLSASH